MAAIIQSPRKTSLVRKLELGLIGTGIQFHTKKARAWLLQKIQEINTRVNVPALYNASVASGMSAKAPVQGRMFFFFYNPKTKDKLPFYDRFPLVLPIEKYADGFLGLNFHYLPLKYRTQLLDALATNLNNTKMDSTTKFRANYDLLTKASRYRLFKPCVKRYLTAHIQSKMVLITPDQWEICIFLPTERFQKKPKKEVFDDSLNQLGIV